MVEDFHGALNGFPAYGFLSIRISPDPLIVRSKIHIVPWKQIFKYRVSFLQHTCHVIQLLTGKCKKGSNVLIGKQDMVRKFFKDIQTVEIPRFRVKKIAILKTVVVYPGR